MSLNSALSLRETIDCAAMQECTRMAAQEKAEQVNLNFA